MISVAFVILLVLLAVFIVGLVGLATGFGLTFMDATYTRFIHLAMAVIVAAVASAMITVSVSSLWSYLSLRSQLSQIPDFSVSEPMDYPEDPTPSADVSEDPDYLSTSYIIGEAWEGSDDGNMCVESAGATEAVQILTGIPYATDVYVSPDTMNSAYVSVDSEGGPIILYIEGDDYIPDVDTWLSASEAASEFTGLPWVEDEDPEIGVGAGDPDSYAYISATACVGY